MAITGSTANKIRASDFEYVTNGVKVQLLSSAKLLAAAGNAEGQFVLGMLLLETPGNIDINGAFDALAKAAQQNYPDAQVNLALIYQRGLLPGGRDLDKASYWFEKAADNGNAKAQFWLGCYYQYGWGDRTRDSQKSIEEYGKAVAANYAPAREALEVVNGGSAAASPCSK
jgi:TPR repeat protein